jgi:hypothetical protein
VREHGSKGDVAYAFDVWRGCGILRIDNDAAFRVEGDTGGGEVEAFNVGTAANSDENYVSFKLEKSRTSESWFEILENDEETYCLSLTPFRRFSLQINLPILLVSRQNLGV